ncbi:MAG: hypothetical protein WB783_12785 [Arenicellales bacterium]|jgi:hypothetical protein
MQSRQFRLEQRLKILCNKRASKLGLGLTPSCNNLIHRMISHGVQRMESQGVVEKEEQIMHAERNLSHYLDKLSDKAQSIGTYPMVGAKVFDDVFREQCPIWPYC